MVVDLIFLNTEVSLTQALEDVGRARTPFAIIITQQHQVHRSCTVNILFGTPQGQRRRHGPHIPRWALLRTPVVSVNHLGPGSPTWEPS
jgi:hypothetical protein